MTAHEDQRQGVILIRGRRETAELRRRFGFAAAPGGLTPKVIHHASRGDLNQPAAGIVGHAFPRPLHGGSDQGLLNGVLSGGEVMETAHDRTEHLRREIAQQVLGNSIRHGSSGGRLMTGRTSIGMFSGTPPGPGAAEAWAAIS